MCVCLRTCVCVCLRTCVCVPQDRGLCLDCDPCKSDESMRTGCTMPSIETPFKPSGTCIDCDYLCLPGTYSIDCAGSSKFWLPKSVGAMVTVDKGDEVYYHKHTDKKSRCASCVERVKTNQWKCVHQLDELYSCTMHTCVPPLPMHLHLRISAIDLRAH